MSIKHSPLITGQKYHIYNRGVDKRVVFQDHFDYLRFYQSLAFFNTVEPTHNYRRAKNEFGTGHELIVKIEAYSLLPNHFHLLLEQVCEGGISEFMKRVSGGYTNYFNEKNDRSGALFQGKYKKVLIESEKQNNYLFSYVNENHFVHNIEMKREMYHSSSIHYQKLGTSKLIQDSSSLVYNFNESVALASEIHTRRTGGKDLLE